MEKTVRVCDGCGEGLGNIFVEPTKRSAHKCVLCDDKDYCRDCLGGELRNMDMEGVYFCPEHYKEVKEHIEGMKAKQVAEDLCVGGYEKLFVIRSSKGATEAWIGDTKFVPEEPQPCVTPYVPYWPHYYPYYDPFHITTYWC